MPGPVPQHGKYGLAVLHECPCAECEKHRQARVGKRRERRVWGKADPSWRTIPVDVASCPRCGGALAVAQVGRVVALRSQSMTCACVECDGWFVFQLTLADALEPKRDTLLGAAG